MFKKILRLMSYVFSGEMSRDHMDAFVNASHPKDEAARLAAIRKYTQLRGGF